MSHATIDQAYVERQQIKPGRATDTTKAPSPGEQVSEMAGATGRGRAGKVGAGARHLLDLPGATTRHPGRRLGEFDRRRDVCCARAAARSGVARSRRRRFGSRSGREPEHSRSGPRVRRRLALAPGGTDPQLTRHETTRNVRRRSGRSAFTPTCSMRAGDWVCSHDLRGGGRGRSVHTCRSGTGLTVLRPASWVLFDRCRWSRVQAPQEQLLSERCRSSPLAWCFAVAA
jgi:hypothetical protein